MLDRTCEVTVGIAWSHVRGDTCGETRIIVLVSAVARVEMYVSAFARVEMFVSAVALHVCE